MHKADMKLSRYMRMAEPDLTIAVGLQTEKAAVDLKTNVKFKFCRGPRLCEAQS